jgi:hypothetical protein
MQSQLHERQLLLKERNKRIAEAEKVRNLQMKNIQELYEYAIKDINDQHVVSLPSLIASLSSLVRVICNNLKRMAT